MKRILMTLVLCLFVSAGVFAQKTDWDSIVKLTLLNNPSIKSAKLSLDNAKQAYTSAISGYLPDISLSGSGSQRGSDGFTSDALSYGVNANLSVFSGFSTYNSVRQKSILVKSAQVAYNRTVSDVVYGVRREYINLMWAQERVILLEKIKNKRTENKDMVKLKYNSGNVDIGSLRRVEADVEIAALDLRSAQREIQTVSAALANAIGINFGTIFETNEKLATNKKTLEKPNFDSLIVKIPEYLIAQYNVDSSGAQSRIAKSQWFPNVNLSAGISRSNDEFSLSDYQEGWNASVSVSYPLFTGLKRISDVNTASNQLESYKENLKLTIYFLKARAISNYNDLLDAYETIAVREKYLSASQLQNEISERKYVNGLSTYQDWYAIGNDYINSQRQLLDTKKSAALQEAQWHNFIGDGF